MKFRNFVCEKKEEGKKKNEGLIQKKSNGKWGVISGKTGKFWPANYDTKADAEAGLRAYFVHKNESVRTNRTQNSLNERYNTDNMYIVEKKPDGSWGIISGKVKKWWDVSYDTRKEAQDALFTISKAGNTAEYDAEAIQPAQKYLSKMDNSQNKSIDLPLYFEDKLEIMNNINDFYADNAINKDCTEADIKNYVNNFQDFLESVLDDVPDYRARYLNFLDSLFNK